MKYKLKTKAGKAVTISIPEQVSIPIKDMILDALKQSIDKEHTEQMIHEFENLTTGVKVLVEHLKKDKIHSKRAEELINETITIYLERGIEMGKYISADPDRILEITRMPHPDIKSVLETMKNKERWMSEYILHSFLLGKQCYETGLALSALLSLKKQEKYAKKLESEVSKYIW